MTQDFLAELAKVSNHEEAVANQALSDAFRPRNRHVVQSGSGKFVIKERATRTGTGRDGDWSRDVAVIRIEGLQVNQAITPYAENYMEFDLPISDRLNSGMGLMVDSAAKVDPAIKSIVDLNGRQVTFEDAVKSNGKDRQTGYDINIWYYKITSVTGAGSASSNGSAAPAKKLSAEDLYPVYEGAQGMTFVDAQAKYGSYEVQRVILGKDSAGATLPFKLRSDEGTLVADGAATT